MTARALLAPVASAEGSRLGRLLFRKQVLKQGEIDYKGQRINFDHDYLVELANAFNQGAYDQVPFLIADRDNAHTLDPERMRGEVTSLVVTPDGLDAFVSLSADGAKLVKANPKLGVSARIVEDLTHADGRSFKKAIQHVLGTLDPRLTGMSPWQQVALATDDIPVVDLTSSTYLGGPKMATITDEELEELQALRAAQKAQETPPTDAGEPETLTDEQIAEMLGADAAEEPELVGAQLSTETRQALEFAQGQLDQQRIDLAGVRAELDATRWQAERKDLLDGFIPMGVIDAARPLLEGAGKTIDLSNGQTIDAGAVMREVLAKVKELIGTLNLSTEMGGRYAQGGGVPDQEAETKSIVDQYLARYGGAK